MNTKSLKLASLTPSQKRAINESYTLDKSADTARQRVRDTLMPVLIDLKNRKVKMGEAITTVFATKVANMRGVELDKQYWYTSAGTPTVIQPNNTDKVAKGWMTPESGHLRGWLNRLRAMTLEVYGGVGAVAHKKDPLAVEAKRIVRGLEAKEYTLRQLLAEVNKLQTK